MTFTQVLNHPQGRALVNQIEDVSSSLDAYPNGDPTLEAMLSSLLTELYDLTGFRYMV
jgi:hypothetical protein